MKKFSFFLISILMLSIFNFNSLSTSQDWSGDSSSQDTSSSPNSNDDSNDWSSAPPGGQSSTGSSVATLITAPSSVSSTPISSPTQSSQSLPLITLNINPSTSSSGPTNHPFADLYSGLINLQGALLESINVYWNTTNPPQPSNGCNFSNLPSSVDSIMQGQMGPCFSAVFMPGSLPLQILLTIQKTLITYVQGMTRQLTIDTYNTSAGNDFVTFTHPQLNTTPGTFTGNLAYIDQVWKNTYEIINTTFEKLRSSNKFNNQTIQLIQNTLQKIADTYTQERYHTIITWYTHLVRQLAQRFNPNTFTQGLFSYTLVPNCSALTGYSNAFIDACNQLTQYYNTLSTSGSFCADTLSLVVNQKATPSNTIFTDPQSFFTTLQNTTLNRLGDICAYLTLFGLQRANDRVQHKELPQESLPPVISYNALQDVPTFLTTTQNSSLSPLPFLPGTQLPASTDFYCAQQLCSALSAYTTGALDAFNFDTPLSAQELFVYDSLSPLIIQTYEQEGLTAPATMLQELQSNVATQSALLQKLQQRTGTSTQNKVAISTDPQNLITSSFNNIGDVFQELIIACSAALDAQYWYNQSGNANAATTYSTKATLLQNSVSALKGACTLLSAAQSQPASQSYQVYLQAGDLLYKCGSAFLTLNLLPLNTYALTLGSYVKVTSYQALLNYYASYYKESLTTYNQYLKKVPSYSYSNGKYTFDVIPGYEKALFTIVYYIDQALSTAMEGYQNQLSFFLSQKKDNPQYLSLIWPIQDALLLLTNFQEAITPLLLQTPCGTTQDNKAIVCGVDYTLIQTTATNVAEQDVGAMIINAHNQYTEAYPFFKTVDTILAKYSPSSAEYKALTQYTSLDALFQLSKNGLNFSQFFLLHQARLYTSVAQRLIAGKPFFWQQGDPVKPQGSAYALLLYAYAAAIYNHLGYAQHAQTVNAMKHLLFSPALIHNFKETVTKTLATPLEGKTPQQIQQMYKELNALCTVLYLSPGDATHVTFLEMLSMPVMRHDTLSLKTLGSCGYADWLATNPKGINNSQLQASLMYFQGALIATQRNDVHADTFSAKAHQSFEHFVHNVDAMLTTHVTSLRKNNSGSSGNEYYESSLADTRSIDAQIQEIKKLIDIKNAYDDALYQMDFMHYVFSGGTTVEKPHLPRNISTTCSRFLTGSLNLPGIIGDVYFSLGNKALSSLQSSINSTLGKNLSDDFAKITNYYTEAKNFYGIATMTDSNYQQKFLDAEYALSDAYAYQSYATVIPLFNIVEKSLTIAKKSSAHIPSVDLPAMTTDQASARYSTGSPLFLLRQRTTQIPTFLAQSFKQDSQDSLSLLKTLVSPLFASALFSQVRDQTPKDTIQSYVDEYTNNYRTLCSSGITRNSQTMHGSLSYTAKNSSLQLAYEPLPAIPRFNAEILSAITYYSDGCGKLYAANHSPVNYHGKLLIPSNNVAGQDLTTQAILNTYLSRAVELTSTINTLKQNKKYQLLQSMPVAQRVKQNFYDYVPLYKEIQQPYEELIGIYIATNSFLSNYGTSASACSELIAKTIVDWMHTNSQFFCGIPDITTYGALLHTLVQSVGQIQKYTSQFAQGEQYIIDAATIFAQAYDYCAQAFAITPDTILSTTNPDTSTTYPILSSSLPTYMRWKDAGTYSVYAGNFLEKTIHDIPTLSLKTKNTLTQKAQSYYAKAITYFLQYSTFNAALFCSNAYQECRCKTVNGTLNTVQLEDAGNPNYPSWDYPYTGYIPQVTPATYYTYPVCEIDPNPSGTSCYIFSMPPAIYQGVASMEVPLFATCKTQSSQGQQSPYTSMYTTMQQTFLNAFYYYQQTLGLIKKMMPTTKVSKAERDARQKEANRQITAWIIDTFNKHPNFHDPVTNKDDGLPAIMIQTTSDKTVTINKKASHTSETVLLYACKDLQISLGNPQQLYLHTLRYWASRSNFYTTLISGLLQWCTPGNYDIAQTFLTDVISMFQSFFIRSYLPTLGSSDAQYQVQQMIQNSQQDSSGTSAGYF